MKKILHTLLLLFSVSFAFSQVNLTNGLIAFYQLNGNAIDSGVNSLHGNLIGTSPDSNRFGKPNMATKFNGAGDAINVAHNTLLNLTGDKTISLWYKINDSAGFTQFPVLLYKKGNDNYPTFGVYFREDAGYPMPTRHKVCFIQGKNTNDNKEVFAKERYRDNLKKWVHVVATYTSSDGYMRIYLDGQLSDSLSAPSFTSNTSTDSLQIGRGNSDNYNANYFKGSLDDIRLYNRAVNRAEVAALLTENVTTGIEKINNKNNLFVVYPNPSSGVVSISSISNYDNKATLDVFDMQGKIVFTSPSIEDNTINLSQLKTGVYVIQLTNNNIVERHRLIIK